MKKGDQEVKSTVLSKGDALKEEGTKIWATLESLISKGASKEDCAFLRKDSSAVFFIVALLKTLRLSPSEEYADIIDKLVRLLAWEEEITGDLIDSLVYKENGCWTLLSSDKYKRILIKVDLVIAYDLYLGWGRAITNKTTSKRLIDVLLKDRMTKEVFFDGLVTSGELNIILRSPDKF